MGLFFPFFKRLWGLGGELGEKKKAVSGFCLAAFRVFCLVFFFLLFLFTKKQPDDLLMVHLLSLFVPKGTSRLAEMNFQPNRLHRFSFACVVMWPVWLCNVLRPQLGNE